MYPHTNDIAKNITCVNVSHSTVKIFYRKRGLISSPLYYFGLSHLLKWVLLVQNHLTMSFCLFVLSFVFSLFVLWNAKCRCLLEGSAGVLRAEPISFFGYAIF